MKNYNLKRCPICHNIPVVTDVQGIGDVYCQQCCIKNGGFFNTAYFHYSGKMCTKKREAIQKWNLYATLVENPYK